MRLVLLLGLIGVAAVAVIALVLRGEAEEEHLPYVDYSGYHWGYDTSPLPLRP